MELKSSSSLSDIHNQSMSNSSTSSTSSNTIEMSPMKVVSKPAIDNEIIKPVDHPVDDNQLEMSNEMIDDEDFVDSSDEEVEEDENLQKTLINRNILLPIDEMEHKSLISGGSERKKATSIFKSRLMKGVSLGNLKFPFHSSTATPKTSPKLKKSKSSSILIDIEKEDEKRKLLMKSATESFNSSEESDMYFSMDHTKESWHVDVSNINYFLNQTGMQDHQGGVRNSMSPITKSTQRMPKSMQVRVLIV